MREGFFRVLERKLDPCILSKSEQLNSIMKSEPEINSKNSPESLKLQQYFTVSDISNALGMEHEEKTMSRVL
jgi:hypothetical protein